MMRKPGRPAQPLGRFPARGGEAVAAFADDQRAAAQPLHRRQQVGGDGAAFGGIGGEQSVVGQVPAFAGHGPVLARGVEHGGAGLQAQREELGLARVYGEQHARALLVHRDARGRVADADLRLFLDPLHGVQPVRPA